MTNNDSNSGQNASNTNYGQPAHPAMVSEQNAAAQASPATDDVDGEATDSAVEQAVAQADGGTTGAQPDVGDTLALGDDPSKGRPPAYQWADLHKFQRDVLEAIAAIERGLTDESTSYGLAIKRSLEAYYGSEVNHGRLYPNLDELAQLGLVEKADLDRRTNEYTLTEQGEEVLEAAARDLAKAAGLDEEEG